MSHEQLFLDHLDTINIVIAQVCRGHHASVDEAEEFRSLAHVKLIEDDYRVLREWQQRASIRTYLSIVLQRVFLDYRNSKWGKWRPSVVARKNGRVAIRLEQLIVRDGYTFEEAFEALRTNYRVTLSREELDALAAQLPIRVMRKTQTEDALVVVPDRGPRADALISRDEIQVRIARVHEILSRLLRGMAPRERLIIKLRYVDGLTVVQIAALLKEPAKPLYRDIDLLKARLRKQLEGAGIDRADVFDDED